MALQDRRPALAQFGGIEAENPLKTLPRRPTQKGGQRGFGQRMVLVVKQIVPPPFATDEFLRAAISGAQRKPDTQIAGGVQEGKKAPIGKSEQRIADRSKGRRFAGFVRSKHHVQALPGREIQGHVAEMAIAAKGET
jgi:hypothetical protein